MANDAVEDGVREFIFKPAGGADAALCREGAAEHSAPVRQPLAAEAALNEVSDRKHAVELALLVQHARATNPCKRTQDHLIPMTGDVLQFPQHGRDGLVTHLLG